MKKKQEYVYVLRRANSGTIPIASDIIGVCMTEDEAKKHMTVFCYYEKVKVVKTKQ